MLGNFAFLFDRNRIDDYGEQFAQNCDELEQLYASGFYTSCVSKCRACCETLVRRIYQEEIYEMPQNIDGKYWQYCNYYELLNANEFVRAIGNPWLARQLDQARLEAGNTASHDMDKTYGQETALRHLGFFHELLLNYEQHVYEYPVQNRFFEPSFEESAIQEDEPLIRDYPELIQEALDSGDRELAAKWAFLNLLNDPKYEMPAWTNELSDHSEIYTLIHLISDRNSLQEMLSESSVRLSMLISKCYGDFHWSEVDKVVYAAAQACRSSVSSEAIEIENDLDIINHEVEAFYHG